MEVKKNYLNRKKQRKEERKNKKLRKNLSNFYRHGKLSKEDLQQSSAFKGSKKQYDDEVDYHAKDNDDDEEIDSDQASIRHSDDSEVEEEHQNKKFSKEKKDLNAEASKFKSKEILQTPFQDIDVSKIDEDLDKELEYLEKRLRIKEGKNYDTIKKKAKRDNYDADMFDFLDKIEEEVKQEKQKLGSSKNKNIVLNETNQSTASAELDANHLKSKQSKLENKPTKIPKADVSLPSYLKELNSVFNKTSESNIQLLYKNVIDHTLNYIRLLASSNKLNKAELIELYKAVSNNILKAIFENLFMNIGITSCLSTYLSILHYVLGDSFLKYFLRELFKRFHELSSLTDYDARVNKLKNFTFIMIFLFLFKNLTMKLAYDIINLFIVNFDDYYSEVLYILLSHIGIQLRKEDPNSIKLIIQAVNQKYTELRRDNQEKVTSKIKFVIEMIEDIKNNKFLKFNLSEKYAFFTNLISNVRKEHLGKSSFTSSLASILKKGPKPITKLALDKLFETNDQVEISLADLESLKLDTSIFNAEAVETKPNKEKKKRKKSSSSNASEKSNKSSSDSDEEGEESEEESSNLDNDESDEDLSIDSGDIEADYDLYKTSSKNKVKSSDIVDSKNEKIQELCKRLRINTDLKKQIFKAIINSDDYLEAYERLIKMSLNKEQNREIIKLIILISIHEKNYNQFYTLLISRLISYDKSHKYTYHFTIWDYLRNIDALPSASLQILAILTAELLVKESISLLCFLPTDIMIEKQAQFLFIALDFYFENCKYDTLKLMVAKLIVNDEHNDFYKLLFGFLNSDFPKRLDLSSKIENYIRNIEGMKRILKKVL